MPNKQKLCVIDADSLIYIHSWRNKDDDDFYNHKESIKNGVRDILSACGATHYVGFLSGRKNFRYQRATIKPYKGNRAGTATPKFYHSYKEYLTEELLCYSIDKLEADDLCKIAKERYEDIYDITIASPDKDLKQFPGEFYDYGHDVFSTITEEAATRLFWLQVLTGDTSDNIPGLPGIGPKKAEALLDGIPHQDLYIAVYKAYIKELGFTKGLTYLSENFDLLYLLGNKDYEGEFNPTIVELDNTLNWK